MTKRAKAPGDEKILAEARARFKEAQDADSTNRTLALDDIKFAWNYNDYQWPADVKILRKNRPCLTENRLPQFLRQVVNGQRMNRPSIKVTPLKDGSVAVAQILEGLVRHVEQWSKADLAYDLAFEAAVCGGVGYFRVTTKYLDDEGFDQDISVEAIDNPFSVYDDPHFQVPDGSDRKYCFVTEMVDRDEFEAEYGFLPTNVDESGAGENIAEWFEKEQVRVAEYWRVVTTANEITDPTDPKRKRTVKKNTVEQYLMTGDTIIQKSEWLGCYIPIIPVFGEVKNIEGRKHRKSLIRDVKDLQRINNYYLSNEVEFTALQPRAPFVGPTGAFDTDEEKWQTANNDNWPYLQYDGEVPPQRQPPPAFPDAFRTVRMGVIEGMKAGMGIYDASLGARSNETSGVAINERKEQGDESTYHFIDNMTRAMRYAGLCILDLIPKVYDAPRTARIVEPDGNAQMQAVNQLFIDPQTMQAQNYDLKAGKYDVVVKAGPSWETKREENTKMLSELIRAMPQLGQLAGDLLIKAMDFPDAEKVAERLDPQIQQKLQQAQQMQQQIQHMGEQLQQGQQAMQAANDEITKLTQKNNEQRLQAMSDVTNSKISAQKVENDAAAKVLDYEIKLMALQQKQTQDVIGQAQAMQQPTEQLLQGDGGSAAEYQAKAEAAQKKEQDAADAKVKDAESKAKDDQLREHMLTLSQAMMARMAGPTIQ